MIIDDCMLQKTENCNKERKAFEVSEQRRSLAKQNYNMIIQE